MADVSYANESRLVVAQRAVVVIIFTFALFVYRKFGDEIEKAKRQPRRRRRRQPRRPRPSLTSVSRVSIRRLEPPVDVELGEGIDFSCRWAASRLFAVN